MMDAWEARMERTFLAMPLPRRGERPAREQPLSGLDMGMLEREVNPCPCGCAMVEWAKGEVVPACCRCGRIARSVTGFRIVW